MFKKQPIKLGLTKEQKEKREKEVAKRIKERHRFKEICKGYKKTGR